MRPRLLLDIGYADLFSALSPICTPSRQRASTADIKLFPQSVICLSARSACHALLQNLKSSGKLPPAAPIIYSAITKEIGRAHV